jgi:hypothetical protein
MLPYTMSPPIYAPHWDPMWKLISDASAVASMHLRFGGTRPPDPPLPDGIKRNWSFSVNIVMGYFSAIQPLTELIYTGLFERFPDLKFVHAEVDMGWVHDFEGLRLAREGNDLIARAAMFSIDHPHELTLFGTTQKVLADLTAGLDPKVKHDILAGTAMRLYNLGDASAAGDTSRAAVAVR